MYKKLFKAFADHNESLYFVGGYVRDFLIHERLLCPVKEGEVVREFKPNDVDFTTSAKPEKIVEILQSINLKAIPIGIEFGTIQTTIDDMKIEITTFRCSESYKKGSRKPSVKFGGTLEEDLERRDFTYNAIAMDGHGTIIDPCEGFADLITGLIATPIDPEVSFSDDPLRLLRACRFSGKSHGGSMEYHTGVAMEKLSHKIREVSPERIFEEMSKLLLVDEPDRALRVMAETGVLRQIFPDLQNVIEFKNDQGEHHSKNVWEHTLGVVANSPKKLEVRWAALFHDAGKPFTYEVIDDNVHFYGHEDLGKRIWDLIADDFKVSNKLKSDVGFLIENHMRPGLLAEMTNVSDKAVRRFTRKVGDKIDDLFDLSLADITSQNELLAEEKKERCLLLKDRVKILIEKENIIELRLPAGIGKRIIEEFDINPGPFIGTAREVLEEWMVDGKIDPDNISTESLEEAVLAAVSRFFGE